MTPEHKQRMHFLNDMAARARELYTPSSHRGLTVAMVARDLGITPGDAAVVTAVAFPKRAPEKAVGGGWQGLRLARK